MNEKINKVEKTRLVEFDIIKCLAIFVVLWGHSILHLSSDDASQNGMYQFITSFHMPLFMLVAGFFSAGSLNKKFKDFISRKFMQLIYPAITFGVIFFLADSLLIVHEAGEDTSLLSYLVYCLWFLKSCFLCYIILWTCLKIGGNRCWLGCALAILCSFLLPFFKLNWMLPFFICGFLLAQNFDVFKNNTKWIFPISIILYTILYLTSEEFRHMDLMSLKSSLMQGDTTILGNYFAFQGYRIIIGLLGSFMIISGIFCLVKSINLSKFYEVLGIYGQHTMGIYILQTFLLEILMRTFIDLHGINIYIFNFLITPLISLGVMIACSYLIKWINRSKKLNRILWGK